jgi:hypothetical protein
MGGADPTRPRPDPFLFDRPSSPNASDDFAQTGQIFTRLSRLFKISKGGPSGLNNLPTERAMGALTQHLRARKKKQIELRGTADPGEDLPSTTPDPDLGTPTQRIQTSSFRNYLRFFMARVHGLIFHSIWNPQGSAGSQEIAGTMQRRIMHTSCIERHFKCCSKIAAHLRAEMYVKAGGERNPQHTEKASAFLLKSCIELPHHARLRRQ